MSCPFVSHRKTDPELNYLIEKAEVFTLKGRRHIAGHGSNTNTELKILESMECSQFTMENIK